MKPFLRCLTALMLVAALSTMACSVKSPEEDAPCAGCYSSAAVTAEGVRNAAAFAVQAEQEALCAQGQASVLELVAIEHAEQQVVAGMNYRLKLKVKLDGEGRTAEAVVYEKLWEPVQRELTSWTWQ